MLSDADELMVRDVQERIDQIKAGLEDAREEIRAARVRLEEDEADIEWPEEQRIDFNGRLRNFPDGELVYMLLMMHRELLDSTGGKMNHYLRMLTEVLDVLLGRFAGAAYARGIEIFTGEAPSPFLEAAAD